MQLQAREKATEFEEMMCRIDKEEEEEFARIRKVMKQKQVPPA